MRPSDLSDLVTVGARHPLSDTRYLFKVETIFSLTERERYRRVTLDAERA